MTAERKTIWSERLRTPAGIGTDTAFSQETASKFNPSCLSRTVLSMWYVHGAVRTGCTEQSVNSVVDSCCSMSPSTGEWLLGDQNHGKPQVGSDHYLDALLDFWQAMNTEADRTSIPLPFAAGRIRILSVCTVSSGHPRVLFALLAFGALGHGYGVALLLYYCRLVCE